MSDRPKLKLSLTMTDKIIELVGWIALIAIWVLTLYHFYSLPNTIPIHYNGAGEVDSFGNKWNILSLPIVSSIVFIGMTVLNRYPHVFNYPSTVTQENAFQQYTTATRLVRFLKLVVVVIFGIIVYQTIQNANGNADGLGVWFLPLMFGLVFIPIVYYLTKSSLKKNSST